MKKNKRKILFCSPLNLSSGSGIARWANHIYDYYKSINCSNLDVIVYPMHRAIYLDETANIIQRAYLGIKDYARIVKGICAKVSNDRFDIIHITSSASIGLFKDLYLLKKLSRYNVKTYIHFHFGRIPELYSQKNWEWKLLCKVAKLASKIIVLDKASYNALVNAGICNVVLLPNPLTPKIKNIVSHNQDLVRNRRNILFVGHVYKTKGVYELVEACSQISDIHLKIVGKYEDVVKDELIALSSKKQTENWIEFTGNLSFEEVIREMLSCGIFVLPTYTEGFPNVILESMACGCPIVTTKVGAIPEMLDIVNGDYCGKCVDPKNVEQLKEAIVSMLDNRKYAEDCGYNAQKRVNECYSISTIWKELENIWQNT